LDRPDPRHRETPQRPEQGPALAAAVYGNADGDACANDAVNANVAVIALADANAHVIAKRCRVVPPERLGLCARPVRGADVSIVADLRGSRRGSVRADGQCQEEEAMGKPKKTSGKKAPNDLAVKDGKTVKGGAFCAKGSHIPKVTLHLYR
jgi:hypothetical protein